METIRCLLIDDREEEQEFFKIALTRSDLPVVFEYESSAENAFRKLLVQEKLPDHIFLDMNMPGMNGQEFLAELKQTPRLQNIQVLAYSIGSPEVQTEELLRLGAAAYIIKPQSIDTMVKTLKYIFTNRRVESTPAWSCPNTRNTD